MYTCTHTEKYIHRNIHTCVLSVINFTLHAQRFYSFVFISGACSAGNTQKNSSQGEVRLKSKLLPRYTWNPLEWRKMMFPRLEFSPAKAANIEITARKWGAYGSFFSFFFPQHKCLIGGIMVSIGKWNKFKFRNYRLSENEYRWWKHAYVFRSRVVTL